ncbi:MAG: DNA gyrase inhibitor YacG [Acidobacteriota bacterium]|jgi:endogenous inhibitor of DNA gyrase (YacG/DUF329 family)
MMKCPQCGKEITERKPACRPFCSDRCKLIDLGKWISGEYRIATEDQDEKDNEEPQNPNDPEEE